MKKQFTILFILFFSVYFFPLFCFASWPVIADESQIPKITSVFPLTVTIGDTFELIGENLDKAGDFDTLVGGVVVQRIKFTYPGSSGGSSAEVINRTNDKIIVKTDSGTIPANNVSACIEYSFGGSNSDCYGAKFTIKEACNWKCSNWSFSMCPASGIVTETRTCTKPIGCESLSAPMPATTQAYPTPCVPSNPTCTLNDWDCAEWSSCSILGKQYRDCPKISVCDDDPTTRPTTSQSCTYIAPVPSCISFNYSSWSQCTPDGKQTRNITSKYPSNCEGGESPATTQSCTYSPPTPSCTADTWTCGTWNSCSLSGIQNRNCTKTFDCPDIQTAPPTTDQYCEPPNRPTPQTPPSGTDEILNQDSIIKSSVKLVCPVDAQRASQGSGTVIDPSGIILTNKHVIAGTLGCIVGFINDFNDEPYFGERQIADIFKLSSNQDVAVLKIRNPKNTKLSYVDITKGSVNFPLGTKITTYGYPAKFGTNITYTSGDFSGTDGSYLKTTAILEYGNSGGGAYLKNGTFVGIPSAVVKGQLNAMGYLLSINTINSWLGNSSTIYGDTSNNNYSRVSILEDIDLKKLNSLKLFIPDTDAKGDLSDSAKNKAVQNSQNAKEKSQPNQTQKESTIIEPTDTNQKTNSEQRRSMVANAVQEMVKVAERNGGIGQQIKTIAQTQTQNQEKLETSLQKIQSRSGFTKFFVGPNYSEIKNSQKLLGQNKEQIQKLNDIRTKIVNQGDQLQVVEQIQALEQVNQQIETSLNESQKGFSLFGWAFKLFSR